MLRKWSFSSLTLYEGCPHKYRLKYIDRVPEPELPADNPMVRGNAVHKKIEDYLTGHGELPVEAQSLTTQYEELRAKPLTVEEDWGFTQDWQFTTWDEAICRMKLDAFTSDGDSCLIVDHKTGKPNPIKHASQGQLYAVGAASKEPSLEYFKVEFWYPDQGKTSSVTYKRPQVEKFKLSFNRRAEKLQTDNQFKPISNSQNCKYCPYGDNGNATCDYRYT